MKSLLRRPITSYSRVQRALAPLLRNRGFHIRRDAIVAKEYLNLGCGLNTDAAFINLDYEWRPGIDICWDVTRGLPLESGSLRGVFSEHCFEHLPFEKIERVLRECWRVLKPGGILRIAVPDGELYLRAYMQLTNGDTDAALPYAEYDVHEGLYSPIMSVNRIFRGHGHLFIYDFDALRKLLEKNGFVDVCRQSFRKGRDDRLLIDSAVREVESLYLDARKPDAQ